MGSKRFDSAEDWAFVGALCAILLIGLMDSGKAPTWMVASAAVGFVACALKIAARLMR